VLLKLKKHYFELYQHSQSK